eukprot:966828_1
MGKCLSDTPSTNIVQQNQKNTKINESIPLISTVKKEDHQMVLMLLIDSVPKQIQQVTISKTATVADLKQLVSKTTNIRLNNFKLSIQSLQKPLQKNNLYLLDYGIMNDSWILVQSAVVHESITLHAGFRKIPFQYLSLINYNTIDYNARKVRNHFEHNMAAYNGKIIEMYRIEKNKEFNINKFNHILNTKKSKQFRWLYHGTAFKHLDNIIRNGFDYRCNKRSAYGTGTYFAGDPKTSSQYCQRYDNKNAFYCMFACRTFIGESVKGNNGKSWKKSDGTQYDSFVDNVKNPNIYAIKEYYQSIPE